MLLPVSADPNPTVPIVALLGWIILGIIQVVLFVAALISILRSPRYTAGGKFLWVIVVLLAPLLGAVGWFVAGRRAQIRTSTP
ncbi:MAG: PLDc N-terminal domain-containing protein [Salinibacterium sp.]|nr:PLDc N-terminal domain-containing protein [Salinibacterium sp.]